MLPYDQRFVIPTTISLDLCHARNTSCQINRPPPRRCWDGHRAGRAGRGGHSSPGGPIALIAVLPHGQSATGHRRSVPGCRIGIVAGSHAARGVNASGLRLITDDTILSDPPFRAIDPAPEPYRGFSTRPGYVAQPERSAR